MAKRSRSVSRGRSRTRSTRRVRLSSSSVGRRIRNLRGYSRSSSRSAMSTRSYTPTRRGSVSGHPTPSTSGFGSRFARNLAAGVVDTITGLPIGTAINQAYQPASAKQSPTAGGNVSAVGFGTFGSIPKGIKFTTGSSLTREVYGNVADTDCVYLGISSVPADDGIPLIIQAIYRKLFKKGGVDIPDPNRPLLEYLYLGTSTFSAIEYYKDSITLVYQKYDAATGLFYAANTISINIAETDTLASLCANAAMLAEFQKVSSGQGGDANTVLVRMTWGYTPDNGDIVAPGKFPTVKASLDLQRCKFHLRGVSEIKFQNRTVSVAGENDAESIDNVPIKGKYYFLKNPYPLTSTQEVKMQGPDLASGVMLARATDMSTDGFKVPPPSGYFTNCEKSGSVQVGPGEIKTVKVMSYNETLGCTKFLQKFNYYGQGSPTPYVSRNQGVGKMIIFAFEKLMRTASSESVKVFYESSQKIACFVTEHPTTHILTNFESTSKSL